MTVMPVKGEVLKWARETRRITLEAAAKKLKWEVGRLQRIEADGEAITDAELASLAKAYKLPVPTLLMPAPLPSDRYGPRPLADLRLHEGGRAAAIGLDTLQYIEDAWELLDLMVDLGETARLPEFNISHDATAVARMERQRFDVSVAQQLGWKDERQAYLTWRALIEGAGVVVHALNIKEEDIRGFALYLDGAGLITINKNEPKDRAKTYSLWHEYAHLLLRCSGLSDQNRSVPVERWCNQFAAAFLLPADEVRQFARDNRLLRGMIGDYQVSRVASAFKVSNSAVAIRFEELGFVPPGFYERLKANWQRPPKRGGFDPEGSQVKTELNRYGTRHVSIVLNALKEGKIDPVEARYALDVNPRYHDAILKAAQERQQTYGQGQAA